MLSLRRKAKKEVFSVTKIDIFSGFLGAGKTTLIKKLIKEAFAGEKLVLIENEFGEIGIDGGFMKEAGIEITEMNSGCICCSLVGDFGRALEKVLTELAPDRILIEPSGVGKLSDVIRAVEGVASEKAKLNSFTTVVDANKCKMYMKNFGEFFGDQIDHAGAVILSHTDKTTDAKLADCVALIREHNPNCTLVTTPWSELDGKAILAAIEGGDTLEDELKKLAEEAEEHHHHHHHYDENGNCSCGHHHDDDDDDDEDDDDEDEHEHHHHHDGEECSCGHHHHDDDDDDDDDDHDEHCSCGHHHHHHHGHDADEIFTSWGVETTKKFTREELESILTAFDEDSVRYGVILRAKGIVPAVDGGWFHFDFVPDGIDVRNGTPDVTGRLCVIGSNLNEGEIAALFGVA